MSELVYRCAWCFDAAGIARQFSIERAACAHVSRQTFNVLNHANYYVENGTGVNPIQYSPFGSTCGDGKSLNPTCYLAPSMGPGGFGTLQVIHALNGPRVFQFAAKWSF